MTPVVRIWRLDSGNYEQVSEQVVVAWEGRCGELQAQGYPPLAPLELMNSNLSSVDDIAAVSSLHPRIKPTTLAFGTLADGFLPFLEPDCGDEAAAAVDGTELKKEKARAATAAAAGAGAGAVAGADAPVRPTITLASVVMKLVQARPPRQIPTGGGGGGGGGDKMPVCAIKLGDDGGGGGGKVQVDPRLDHDVAMKALHAAVEMARGSATSVLDSDAVSAVLAEAYDMVTRRGVLMAVPPQ
ncbi:hypothetical protein Vafri_2962 [Volvox africanus]|uniref:Uncharacterized protein n=1 Tax=Volvox africanus TaxID=51714 RepID=A0A8J4AUG2_9CHLO|nr:hypothetical protein Vafri_2962 [Volvox africanus]